MRRCPGTSLDDDLAIDATGRDTAAGNQREHDIQGPRIQIADVD
jgi:hypothetical protein